MGMSLSGYRKWEQGTRSVSGPADALLARDPEGTRRGSWRTAVDIAPANALIVQLGRNYVGAVGPSGPCPNTCSSR